MIVERVLACIRAAATGDAPVLAAVSGGRDSMVLLDALVRLRAGGGPAVAVCHVHHGMRGAEADRDAAFVRASAGRCGVPFALARADVPGARAAAGGSAEAVARELRYRALREAADALGPCRVATAHHRRDQAETVLDRMLRGAGLAGLGGMARSRALGPHELIRPFLSLAPEELDAYARAAGVAFVTDSTNLDWRYRRNRIRLDLLPALREQYNARVDDALWRLAETARADAEWLDACAREEAGRLFARDIAGRVCARGAFRALPVALQRRTVKLVLEELDCQTVWDFARIEEVRTFASGPGTGRRQISGRVLCAASAGQFALHSIPDDQESDWPPLDLPVGGSIRLPRFGWTLTAQTEPAPAAFARDPWEAWLAPPAAGRMIARPWRRGDSLRPLGLGGRKLVSDVLADAKVPREGRPGYPLLTVGGAVAWIPGLCRGDACLAAGDAKLVRVAVVR